MYRRGRGVFVLKENEIQHILMGDNSDDEDDLLLDEEDQRLLTQDDDQGVLDVEIEAPTLWPQETGRSSPQPSTSARESANSTGQTVFKWSQRGYVPNAFASVEYDFGQVQICTDTEGDVFTPFEIFLATAKFDISVQIIVAQSAQYAHQNGREFSVQIEEMKAFLGMNLIMGYHTLPSLRDYWSTEPDMAVPYISNVCFM